MNIKQTITILILGLSLGMLIMINQACKQKDSMIRLLMKTNKYLVNQNNDMPKNLPIITK